MSRYLDAEDLIDAQGVAEFDVGDWYLVTEFIDGETLDEYAAGKRHLRDREAIDVALDILDALVAIHPDAARIEELDRKKHEGEPSAAESALRA